LRRADFRAAARLQAVHAVYRVLALQKIFKTLARDPEVRAGGKREFIQKWASYAQIENISAIGGDDIEISREGGNLVISAAYTKKVPLFKNVSLVIDFAPTSGP